MMSDVWIVLRFWGTLFLIGAAAFPFTKHLFRGWIDSGYLFAKAVGMATVTWIVYVLASANIAPFTSETIYLSIALVFALGVFFHWIGRGRYADEPLSSVKLAWIILLEEALFLAAILFWSFIKAHEPSIRGLEKFMDYGFMQSIVNSTYFPPRDMWYPPFPINYYYFGHLATALLTKLSGLDLGYTFNLMLAALFAWCLTMSFGIGRHLLYLKGFGAAGQMFGGVLTAFLVTLAGNMQTVYAFTRGYTGEDVKPVWELLWPAGEFFARLPEGINTYWYANATRFIPFTIHEFPSYSFVVSDVHGHVLSIPFVLLALGLVITRFTRPVGVVPYIFYGFLVGVLLMTNALDGPIYFGLFVFSLVVAHGRWHKKEWRTFGLRVLIVLVAAALSSLPFLSHFTSFVNGIAVNCPPGFLANTSIGPLLFEGVEKCQRSPFWMMYLLWGFFWYCGIAWIIRRFRTRKVQSLYREWSTKFTQIEKILALLFIFSSLLIVFPEFFYFKDIYPQHFRSNTMFKLGYQAFIMYSIVSGYVIALALKEKRRLFLLLLLPQLLLVSIYPLFSVRSYFGELKRYDGIFGNTWLIREYPDDYAAIQWLRQVVVPGQPVVLVEADGDSYTDYERFSVFSGIPTIIGWAVHEWLWRGTYDNVAPRREDVRIIYESGSIEETRDVLARYDVRYIIIGTLEREKFISLNEAKFEQLGTLVYRSGETVIYEF